MPNSGDYHPASRGAVRKGGSKLRTSPELFAQRGNPWSQPSEPPQRPEPPTEFERRIDAIRRKHGKSGLRYAAELRAGSVGTPDPDIDRFTLATVAKSKPEFLTRKRTGRTRDRLKAKIAGALYRLHHKPGLTVEVAEGRITQEDLL